MFDMAKIFGDFVAQPAKPVLSDPPTDAELLAHWKHQRDTATLHFFRCEAEEMLALEWPELGFVYQPDKEVCAAQGCDDGNIPVPLSKWN